MARGRDQLIMDTFVELADTLATDYDIADFLQLLVERSQQILEVDAGGVLLEVEGGDLGLAAATSDKMEKLEAAEMYHGEGPCIDAYIGVKQVVAEDLNEARDRWPSVVPTALEVGMQEVYAFPLRLRGDCIGALNLYREQPGKFGKDDVRMARRSPTSLRSASCNKGRLLTLRPQPSGCSSR